MSHAEASYAEAKEIALARIELRESFRIGDRAAAGAALARLVKVAHHDDELAAEVAAAGARSGELTWRLPLHAEYKELMKGTVADLSNLAAKRKAGTITAASFLEEFVDGKPWAHLDIAGTAWAEDNRPWQVKGATGVAVRLLAELALEPGSWRPISR